MAEQRAHVFQRLESLARKRLCRIALSEAGHDARILRAAIEVHRSGIAQPVLVGAHEAMHDLARARGVRLADFEIFDPADHINATAAAYIERRRGRQELTEQQARAIAADANCFSALGVGAGTFDGYVGGACTPTADVVRAAIRCVGTRPGIKTVSSFFLMLLPADSPADAQMLLFADCGVVAEPTIEQLADIAITTADVGCTLFGLAPRIAMLSFSTRGSAQHPYVTKMRDATRLVQERRPDLACDGEMQLDAAIVQSVAERKAPGSEVAGHANVLIFPDLDAGNIGYKLTQRLANAVAIGPVLQGLAKPVSDLSRGCSVQDVVDAITLTAAQANLTCR
ncbi:MAG: phosphate acetyltransferase [Candidatus Sumerlaeaceae bacterium]